MKKCVVILARGGSKSIPRKNLVKINGQALLSYPIKAAFAAGIDDVWVSSEDEEIKSLAKTLGAKVHNRPYWLAGDLTTDFECFQDFLSDHNQYDYVIHLRATSPQINAKIIQEAVTKFENNYEIVDSLRSVTRMEKSPFKSWFMEKQGFLTPVIPDNDLHSSPRQVLRTSFYQNACIDIIKADTITKKSSIIGERCIPYLMEDDYNIDIDTEQDLTQAKNIFKDQ
mgnify:CR=1 FL=1|jgi:CMP-N-acetylneuraminic acid synthetase|tara:strand:+ start:980 stop:1657 length:678 start_codon:yes stop_codon:yes gene_type:complete